MITDKQIRALREEAVAAGDYITVDYCNRALTDDTIDQDGHEIPFANLTREQARAECASVITEAAGRRDS